MRTSDGKTTLARRVGCILTAGMATLVAGCAGTAGGPIPYHVTDFTQPDAPQATIVDDAYKISPLDTLSIKIFQVSDLSGDYSVDSSGNIAMPLLGSIQAVGLSPRELQTVLTTRLQPRYVAHPDVAVSVKDSVLQRVTVDGAVKNPSVVPARGPMTLLQTVALAGGTSETANAHRVAIFRTIQGKRMAAAFDLIEIRRGKAEDPAVYPGDVVMVDGSKIRAAQKDLLQSIPLLYVFSLL